MFLQPDEFILLLDYVHNDPTIDRHLQPDEILAFGEAGIRTVFRNVLWMDCEPTRDHLDWREIREWLRVVRKAGMKAMLGVGDMAPAFYPDDWYACTPQGRLGDYATSNILSPWNELAQRRQDWFLECCVAELSAPDVLLVRALPCSGEMLLHYQPIFFDRAAREDYRSQYGGEPQPLPISYPHPDNDMTRWLRARLCAQAVRQSRILLAQGDELWSFLHMCFQDTLNTGNQYADHLYTLYRDELKVKHLGGIMFGYFWVSDLVKARQFELAQAHDQFLFIGSEFCEGLINNTAAGIASGARGFITGPLSFDRSHNVVRCAPWMYDAVRDSLAKWRQAKL